MRILHVLDHSLPLHSGYAFRTISILKEQRALGWETFQLTSPKQGESAEVREETVDGWLFHRTPPIRGLVTDLPGVGEIELMGELAHRIEVLARRYRPHLIHAHSPVLNVLPALRVGRRFGIPVVYEIRAFWEDAAVDHCTTSEGSLRYRISQRLETYAAKRANHVVTICEGLRSDLIRRGVPMPKLTVVPNGVDTEKFAMSETSNATRRGILQALAAVIPAPDKVIRGQAAAGIRDNQHVLDSGRLSSNAVIGGAKDVCQNTLKSHLRLDNAVVLGFVGSFYAYEGLSLLIEPLPKILSVYPNVRVLLVGGGFEEERLKQQAADAGLADKVIFTGRVPHDQVKDYYDLIDLLVYPRLPMRLTELVTPLKPLEAMALGRLVLASDVGGHQELIRDGVTGVLFKAGDVSDLADKALGLLGQPSRWPALKHAARAFVESERSWEKCVANYIPVYERLAERAARAV